MSIEQDVKDVIVQTLNVKESEIKIDQGLSDCLALDSTEMVDLTVALEKKLGVKFQAKEITKFSSPRDIINAIESKRNKS